jgi:hypothetical protein
MKIKVVVVVSGGNVQNCYSDSGSVEIEVIDFDNIEAAGKAEVQQAELRVKEVAQTMHCLH